MDITDKILAKFVEQVNNQQGRPYPYSNQIVVCAVITRDKEKALIEMDKRKAKIILNRKDEVIWNLNNEKWIWKNWHIDAHRGYRFYKMLIDKNIDEELFLYVRIKSNLYCCFAELI